MRWVKLLVFVAVAIFGFAWGSGWLESGSKARIATGIHPEREVVSSDWKPFVVVLYAHNDAVWCERSLRSVFEQDYEFFRLVFIDDGSIDETLERAKEFIIASQQQHRVIVMRNEQPLGLLASLRRAVGQCLDREVVVPLSAKNWMTGPFVLSHWNQAFQNPDVWLALGQAISYPSYEWKELPTLDLKQVAKKGWGIGALQGCLAHCFYAALFKQISPQNAHGENYLRSLLDLSGGRVKNVREPICFVNETKG